MSSLPASETVEERYLQLLRIALTRSFPGPQFGEIPPNARTFAKRIRYKGYSAVQQFLRPLNLSLVQTNRATGESMMGMGALSHLHAAMRHVVTNHVPGDFVETGVWRGGGTIYMRAFLEVYKEPARSVWVCDSFEGLPKPNAAFGADNGSVFWESEYMAVSVDQVKKNFQFYGLLDDRVRFLKGFFSDSMPTAPIRQIAVLRLDGDMYESTLVVLEHLYPKLSQGGIVIIDDYGMIEPCDRAVGDYRSKHGIKDPLQIIGYVQGERPLGAYWFKEHSGPAVSLSY